MRLGKKAIYCLGLMLLTYALGNAQTESKFIRKGKESIPMFRELLGLANDANFPADIEKNVLWCEDSFSKRGFTTQRLNTPTVPLLLAEKKSRKKNARTVLIYLQIDGQPVDTAYWNQANPYKAELMERGRDGKWNPIAWEKLEGQTDPEWRIFARAASDAKGPVAAYLAALDLLEEENKRIPFHMKVIMDFEEELGSPQLPQAVIDNRTLLAADMLVIFDGPRHLKNEPTLTFGARGISTLTLDCIWSCTSPTQRSLWQLCTQSGSSPGSADRQYERRGWARKYPRILRRYLPGRKNQAHPGSCAG